MNWIELNLKEKENENENSYDYHYDDIIELNKIEMFLVGGKRSRKIE